VPERSPDGGPWSGGNGVRVAGYRGRGRDFSVYTVIVYANIISLARVKFEAYPVLTLFALDKGCGALEFLREEIASLVFERRRDGVT
jgi:hypothetical protein